MIQMENIIMSNQSSYIKNFILTNFENIETTGFIFFKLSGKTPVYTRQVLIPECFFINLEKLLSAKSKSYLLYSSGKKFGYNYALISSFSNSNDKKLSDLSNYINLINSFIEGTYASKINCDIDLDTKSIRYYLDNFVIINKLSYGNFLPLGAAAGLMSYIFQDFTIEGVLENYNKENNTATLLYGPASYLEEQKKIFISEHNLSNIQVGQEYITFNQVRQLKYSNFSLKTLIDSKFFSYNNGIIMNNDQRYFTLEVSALSFIEKELQDYQKDIYDASFNAGRVILENVKNVSIKTIIDYLSAFGWGDVLILEKNNNYVINANYLPYTEIYKNTNYSIFSGIVSGMLSVVLKREIKFSKIEKHITSGYISLLLST